MTAEAPIFRDHFRTADHFRIHEKVYEAANPKGCIVVTHGIAEHFGRYAYAARQLAERGYHVTGYDLRGHGKSSGKRNYVRRFGKYLDDLDEIIERTKIRFPGLPLFLFGHSMGGGIVTLYAIERNPAVRGVMVSGPSVKVSDDISPFLQKMSRILSVIAPSLPAVKLDSAGLSRDPAVAEDYDRDPLNYRKGIRARTGAELLKATKIIESHMHEITLPILIMHGSEDRLADPEGSRSLYANVSSEDKTLKIYEGFYHEILNEPEKDQVLDDMTAWLDERTKK